MARRLRYSVAMSLDGFIARKDGSYDWIVMDPAIDFAAIFAEFDTLVMGRKTYEVTAGQGGGGGSSGVQSVVFSRTLPPTTKKRLRITNEDPAAVVTALKAVPGKDIWLFGGGELFRTLLAAKLVDTVEVAVMPVLLGDGIPLLPPGVECRLTLSDIKKLPATGIVALAYAVEGGLGPAPRITYLKAAASKGRAKPAASGRRRAGGPKRRRSGE